MNKEEKLKEEVKVSSLQATISNVQNILETCKPEAGVQKSSCNLCLGLLLPVNPHLHLLCPPNLRFNPSVHGKESMSSGGQ